MIPRSTFLRRFAGGLVALVAAPTLLEAKPREVLEAPAPRLSWLSEVQRAANEQLRPQGLYVLVWKDRAAIRGTVFGGRLPGGYYSKRQHFMVRLAPTQDMRIELARSISRCASAIGERGAVV